VTDDHPRAPSNKGKKKRGTASPKPPPLPVNSDDMPDDDEMTTIPAPPMRNTAPIIYIKLKLPRLSSLRPKIILLATVLLGLISLVIFINQDHPPDTVQPAKVLKKSSAKVVLQSAATGYEISQSQLQKLLDEITSDDLKENINCEQCADLNKLWIFIRKNTDSELAKILTKDSLANAFGTPPDRILTYDEMWKFGMLILDVLYTHIDDLQKAYDGREVSSLDADITNMKRKLSDWLLGKRGVYCQVRARYWQQIKLQNPPISKAQRKDMRKLRKERRKFIKAAGYPQKTLIKFCDRNIL